MRIGNRSRLFWTQGKSIFNKKTNFTDDSVKTEEKEALLSETNMDNSVENSETEEIVLGTEIIELGKKISPYLTNLRKVIEEGKIFPNSRDWVDSALPILVNCIEIASQNKRKDLEQLFLDIARIIYSSDRVGKSHLSIDPTLELYSLLCCVVADFMRGKPNRPMFEQWTKSYMKVVSDFSNLGIRLVDDNEEPITTAISENESNHFESDKIISHPSTGESNSPSDILPSIDDTSSQVPESTSIEITQSEIHIEDKPYDEQIIDVKDITSDISNEEYSHNSVKDLSSESLEKGTSPSEEISLTDTTPTETLSQSPFTDNETSTETTSLSSSEIHQKGDTDIHSLLQQINQISQNEVKEILLDTLKAIAEGTPETAKAKAIELAREMAKLEVEKVKTEYRGTEYQIESLGSEINQVEEQLNICQNEIKAIQEELKEQLSVTQKTEQDKKVLENNIETTQNKIEDIERRILELQQEKEIEISRLNQYKENLISTRKTIEELHQTISTLKESIQDFENQAMTLIQRMDLLEKTKSERESFLGQLQKQIKEREKTVRRIDETLKILYVSEEISLTGNTSLSHNLNHENTIDLFNGGV